MDKLDKPGVSDTTREKEERFCSAIEPWKPRRPPSLVYLLILRVHHSWLVQPYLTHTYTYTHAAENMVQVSGGASCQSSGSHKSDRFITTSRVRLSERSGLEVKILWDKFL